jgi:hypothetical protein
MILFTDPALAQRKGAAVIADGTVFGLQHAHIDTLVVHGVQGLQFCCGEGTKLCHLKCWLAGSRIGDSCVGNTTIVRGMVWLAEDILLLRGFTSVCNTAVIRGMV